MASIVYVSNLSKTYASGFEALKGVSLEIEEGEILALLGPNGAGKTTLISIICGIVNPSGGEVTVNGHDVVRDFRQTRSMIGLVPQELTTDAFETVWNTVSFSRGLHGKKPDPAHIEKVLKDLSLWSKKDNMLRELSGGMKRRVLIAKALSHEPRVLFLDEPTAGVDVSLRKSMWEVVQRLRASGVTIILTTHYIEEAEEIADRIAVMDKGEVVQHGTPAEMLVRPETPFVEELIGATERPFRLLAIETAGDAVEPGAAEGAPIPEALSQREALSELLWSGRSALPVAAANGAIIGKVSLDGLVKRAARPR